MADEGANGGGPEADPALQRALDDAAKSVDGGTPATTGEGDTGGLTSPGATQVELDESVAALKQQTQELKDKWLRSAADLENFRKRAAKERDEISKYANERVLKEFLPVADDLDRTLEALATPDAEGTPQVVQEAVRLVHKKFLACLEKHGVTSFDSVGQAFDPGQHEAVQQVHDEAPVGAVVKEFRRGFFLNGRLLRPSMVLVSLGPVPGGAPPAETPEKET